MLLLDTTLEGPASNLALDEALLNDPDGREYLRLWEPTSPLVVLGRSSRLEQEVNLGACERAGAEVLRRVSGGAAIVTGPGCLMYAVVLNQANHPDIASIDSTHRYILGRITNSLNRGGSKVTRAGISDLAIGVGSTALKFSGNSLRVVRSRLLYHGTLMYDFDLARIEQCLLTPPRQPDYRSGRSHGAFVTNLEISRENLVRCLVQAWEATQGPIDPGVMSLSSILEKEKYARRDWTHAR